MPTFIIRERFEDDGVSYDLDQESVFYRVHEQALAKGGVAISIKSKIEEDFYDEDFESAVESLR